MPLDRESLIARIFISYLTDDHGTVNRFLKFEAAAVRSIQAADTLLRVLKEPTKPKTIQEVCQKHKSVYAAKPRITEPITTPSLVKRKRGRPKKSI